MRTHGNMHRLRLAHATTQKTCACMQMHTHGAHTRTQKYRARIIANPLGEIYGWNLS